MCCAFGLLERASEPQQQPHVAACFCRLRAGEHADFTVVAKDQKGVRKSLGGDTFALSWTRAGSGDPPHAGRVRMRRHTSVACPRPVLCIHALAHTQSACVFTLPCGIMLCSRICQPAEHALGRHESSSAWQFCAAP